VLGALALLAVPTSAHAEFVMTLSEANHPDLVIHDLGAPGVTNATDQNAQAGTISYTGTYGDFTLKDLIGTYTQSTSPNLSASLQLSGVITNTTSSAETLKVSIINTDVTFPAAPGSQLTLGSAIGGTFLHEMSGDTSVFQSFASTNGTQYSTVTQTSTRTTTFNPEAYVPVPTGTAATTFVWNGPPLTLGASNTFTITPDGTPNPYSQNISGTTTLTAQPAPAAVVPEPTSLALGAAGFLLVGLHGWRTRKRPA